MTVTALQNLLAAALERDASVEFEPENDDRETVTSHFSLVLDNSPYPEGFPKKHRVASCRSHGSSWWTTSCRWSRSCRR